MRVETPRARAVPSSGLFNTESAFGSGRLSTPSEREQSQWHFQRYVVRLPTAGEIVLMERSWYNRGGVERVMGYCTDEQYRRLLERVPLVEKNARE